ncbi:MAG: tannase/feruloyl esterase family alpha/beta hydrolase [Terracidiphilus sp.]
MLKRCAVAAVLFFALNLAWAQHAEMSSSACEKLAKLSPLSAKVVSASLVAEYSFIPPGSNALDPEEKAVFGATPAFCRVVLLATPTADSAIPIEVWMPAKGWNGRFRGQGNGGFAGSIDYFGLAVAVAEGYASGATDTGHAASGIDASWALGHPEKVIDFGYRAIHEMTEKSKAIVSAFYAEPAKHAYFDSCSDGGREALMEAQRFPADYDGIVAGAPANNWTHLLTNALYNSQVTTVDAADYIPSSKLPAIQAAVLAACDSLDGVADGVLNDPRGCHFKPATMVCQGPETDKCLTAHQAHSLELLYTGAHDAEGKSIFPGYLPGSEDGPGGWAPWITGRAPLQSAMFGFAHGYFSDMVYEVSGWDYKTASIDSALKAAIAKTAPALDSTDPNLKPFIARGGKLILYHGWNDPAISALNTIAYYNAMRAATGEKLADTSVRLFMVPGMQHCDGGPGATHFDQFGLPAKVLPDDAEHDVHLAIEAWVEKGVAPQRIIAAKYAENVNPQHVIMTRPLCEYPKAAKYKGTGDTNDAASFTCATPEN